MPNKELEKLWSDPANWTAIGLYRCADDPRWWVPKRVPWMGWTINIAHRGAVLSLIGLMVAATVPVFVTLSRRSNPSPIWLLVSVLVPVVFVIGLAIWLSRRDR